MRLTKDSFFVSHQLVIGEIDKVLIINVIKVSGIYRLKQPF